MNESFLNMVAESPTLAARWATVQAEAQNAAAQLFGVELSAQEVASMLSARTAVLGDMAFDVADLQGLDKVKAKTAPKDEAKPAKATPAPTTPEGHTRARMRALNEARAAGTEAPARRDPAVSSDVAAIRALLTITDRATRLNDARRLGLGG